MINAQQAREKQLTINWKDNKQLLKTYGEELAKMHKIVENLVNEAIVENSNYVHVRLERYEPVNLEDVARSRAEYKIAKKEFWEHLEDWLADLEFKTKTTAYIGGTYLEITW